MARNEKSYDYRELKTIELVREFLISKLTPRAEKQSVVRKKVVDAAAPPENVTINSIAVVLDGRVEEVIRCQNRLAALLLSSPEFVEFDPEAVNVQVGKTKYEDGKLENEKEQLLSDQEISKLLNKESEDV